ncbi:hypothetical protein Avbf_07313 [Armadillidium vulgare]|nr:hypothetical protein Avbf_07313 [Armadillidium vulgare]
MILILKLQLKCLKRVCVVAKVNLFMFVPIMCIYEFLRVLQAAALSIYIEEELNRGGVMSVH